jgi:hypothetical protein
LGEVLLKTYPQSLTGRVWLVPPVGAEPTNAAQYDASCVSEITPDVFFLCRGVSQGKTRPASEKRDDFSGRYIWVRNRRGDEF